MESIESVLLSPASENHINRGRKRKLNITKWKTTKSKALRAQGKEYVNRKGSVVPQKLPPNDTLVCRCKGYCGASKLQNGYKQRLFSDFHKLSYNEQSRFLADKCINIHEPVRPKNRQAEPRRKCSVFYYLPYQGDRLRVCKQTLADTYRISSRRLQCLVDKIKDDIDVSDRRGKHYNRPRAISAEVKQLIREHINSFPRQESHYSREKTSNEYLSENLNLSRMYNLFLEKFPSVKVAMRTYRAEFANFKLKFGLPCSDTCTVCDKQYIKLCAADTEAERDRITQETTLHQMKAKLGYQQLKADAESAKVTPNLYVIFTDLQQVLFCPTLNHSNMFYQRQLSCYNFAIHAACTNNVSMMFWNETIGHRGSIEISSCIIRYVKENFEKLLPGEERKLIVWSDRCIGQNNNWRMVTTYKLLIDLKYFTDIHQKFLSTGHSFLPCDRDFALIEKQKKRNSAMVPFDWVQIIANSRPSKPFLVVCMAQNDFKDLSKIESSLRKDPKLKISQSVWYKISSDAPDIISARESHNIVRPWKQYSLKCKQIRRENRLFSGGFDDIPLAYKSLLPIKSNKKMDLLNMCQCLKEQEHRNFYEQLTSD